VELVCKEMNEFRTELNSTDSDDDIRRISEKIMSYVNTATREESMSTSDLWRAFKLCHVELISIQNQVSDSIQKIE